MTTLNIFSALIILSDIHEAFSIKCHSCLSFDKYDANCVSLRGRGKDNVDGYYQDCNVLMNACSIYTGKFVHEEGRPRNIVWRQCDTLQDGEDDECRTNSGPDKRVPTTGRKCKCQQDFCNWQEGVDDPNYRRKYVAPGSSTSRTLGAVTSNAISSAVLNSVLHLLPAALLSKLTARTTYMIKSLRTWF